jgi:hypothetical protein
MTNKLLITLGDSWTKGVGCYTPEYIQRTNNHKIQLSREERKYYEDGIEKLENLYSWPAVTSKILNYDLNNLGTAGFTNPGLVKRFIADEYANFRSSYDKVVLVFLLTDPHRFSLYLNDNSLWSIATRGFSITTDGYSQEDPYRPHYVSPQIYDLYMSHMVPHGATKETLFSIRAIEYFAKSCGYDFYWGTAFTPVNEILNNYKDDGCLHATDFPSFKQLILSKYSTQGFAGCNHPNPLGYNCISKWIVNKISNGYK